MFIKLLHAMDNTMKDKLIIYHTFLKIGLILYKCSSKEYTERRQI